MQSVGVRVVCKIKMCYARQLEEWVASMKHPIGKVLGSVLRGWQGSVGHIMQVARKDFSRNHSPEDMGEQIRWVPGERRKGRGKCP